MWYNRFKEGRKDVNFDAPPDRPSRSTTDENIAAVKKIISDNLRITFRDLGSCQAIFMTVLGIKRVVVKIVPKLLNYYQKQSRMDIAQEMLTTFNDDPYSRLYGYNSSRCGLVSSVSAY